MYLDSNSSSIESFFVSVSHSPRRAARIRVAHLYCAEIHYPDFEERRGEVDL